MVDALDHALHFWPRLEIMGSVKCSEGSELLRLVLADILNRIPFDMIELWAPVAYDTARTLEIVSWTAKNPSPSMEVWGLCASRSKFRSGEDLVGRVFETSEAEHHPDLLRLEPGQFGRQEAAKATQLRTAYGFPVVSSDNSPAMVLVLYSRTVQNVILGLAEYVVQQLLSGVSAVQIMLDQAAPSDAKQEELSADVCPPFLYKRSNCESATSHPQPPKRVRQEEQGDEPSLHQTQV
jgi:hypothetical protein